MGSTTRREAAVFDVFGEDDPPGISRIADAALATALFKAGHPGRLLEPQCAQVASDETLAENASGKIAKGACFERKDVADRHLGGGADGLYRNAAPLALPSQLIAESRALEVSCHRLQPDTDCLLTIREES